MERLTLDELKNRVDKNIERFGNAPVVIDDGVVYIKVEDGQQLMLINPNESPTEARKTLMAKHNVEFVEAE